MSILLYIKFFFFVSIISYNFLNYIQSYPAMQGQNSHERLIMSAWTFQRLMVACINEDLRRLPDGIYRIQIKHFFVKARYILPTVSRLQSVFSAGFVFTETVEITLVWPTIPNCFETNFPSSCLFVSRSTDNFSNFSQVSFMASP